MDTPFIRQISVEDWLDEKLFPPYYANRDVTKRMKKPHLSGKILSAEQTVVRAVKLGEELIKIDGHSRAEAWKLGQLERPKNLTVMIFSVSSKDEIEDLYKSFNSREAAETPAEQNYHARKVCEFTPISKFCNTSWKAAFSLLGFNSQVDSLKEYLEEMKIIDSWDIDKKRDLSHGTGTKAAMLKTLRDDPDKAKQFWELYNTRAHVYEINRMYETVGHYRGFAGGTAAGVIYATFLGHFESWKSNRNEIQTTP